MAQAVTFCELSLSFWARKIFTKLSKENISSVHNRSHRIVYSEAPCGTYHFTLLTILKCALIFCSLPHFMSWNNGGWNGSPTAYQYTSLNPSTHLPGTERFIMTVRHQVTWQMLTAQTSSMNIFHQHYCHLPVQNCKGFAGKNSVSWTF